MKAVIKRSVKMRAAEGYFIFEKEKERTDIQDFLNGKEFDDALINRRVTDYLKAIGILKITGELTVKGLTLKETGTLPVREEGKYKIWFTDKDDLLKTKILYFKRLAPERMPYEQTSQHISLLPFHFQAENYYLSVEKDVPMQEITLKTKPAECYGVLDEREYLLTLEWYWQGLESSYYIFNGSIDDKEVTHEHINAPIDLKKTIQDIFPDWDSTLQKLKIAFDDVTAESEKLQFKKSIQEVRSDIGDIEFTDIPLIPLDEENAVCWRNWLLMYYLDKRFYSQHDWDILLSEVNNKEGFNTQKSVLQELTTDTFKQMLLKKNDTHKKSKAFWHLFAADDLNPEKVIEAAEF
ncbi:MAG: hypothetical protein ACTTH7_06750 [Treponema sp.]